MIKFLSIFTVTVVAIGIGIYLQLQKVPDMPDLDFNRWWGDGEKPYREEASILRPFKIIFNETMVEDLKTRLRNRRPYTKPLDGMQSQYGINTIYLEKLLQYWLNEYNFKERANLLNRFPHFMIKVQGLDIHYIRVEPEVKGKKVLPILLMHGWPSSSKEFDKAIPMLTTPRSEYDFVFEVIAVDLPGFGYSQATNKPGLSPVQIGIIMRNLMKTLGFDKFYVHAGDWGSQAATHMATVFPDDVLGYHTNMPISTRLTTVVKYAFAKLFPRLIEDKYKNRLNYEYLIRETGYFHLQATKPDTIGAALADTPAGLAAYIFEKIGVGTNREQLNTPHGGLEKLVLDDLFDTATILWANEAITTSSRLYAEALADPKSYIINKIPTIAPTAVIKLKHEILYQTDDMLRDKFTNLVHSTTLDFGGHFAAMEIPKVLVDDIFESALEFIKFNEKIFKNM